VEEPNYFENITELRKFLDNKTWLILDDLGVGKDLFDFFIKKSNLVIPKISDIDLRSNTKFILVYSQQLHLLLTSYYENSVGDDRWGQFWQNLTIFQLVKHFPDLIEIDCVLDFIGLDGYLVNFKDIEVADIRVAKWLVSRAGDAKSWPQSGDVLRSIDSRLGRSGDAVWLIYNGLNSNLIATDALLSWYFSGSTNLFLKVSVTDKTWQKLNFTNKGHFMSRSVRLK
jgi:hypothetical protein